MDYEPLKDKFENLLTLIPFIRGTFYHILDLLLLRQRYVKRCIRKYAPRGDLAYYDAGAGFCQYSWYVLTKFPQARVMASDLNGKSLKSFAGYAARAFPGRFSMKVADLQEFTPENTYNLVTAVDILEHIPDDFAVLRNFHACMENSGILIISTPSSSDPAAQFTAEHVRPGYDKSELESKVHQAGFRIKDSCYSYGKWGALAWRLSMKYPLMLIKRFRWFWILLPVYYLLLLPLTEFLMRLDLQSVNQEGTGLILVAERV